MSALPQVYASDAELAATDALRDTQNGFAQTQKPPSPAYTQHQQQFTNSYGNSGEFARSQPAPYSQSPSQSQSRAFSPSATTSSRPASLGRSTAGRHVQSPQGGISSVPKSQQSQWQELSSRGAYQYQGDTFMASMAAHLPTPLSSGHADGPQHFDNAASLETLPDAVHRQAWSTQPTFRWFKRQNYDDVPDRWSEREGLKGRGDNTYRPLSVVEQQQINARVERRKAAKGEPRTGQW